MFRVGDKVKCVKYEHWWSTIDNILTIGNSYEVESNNIETHKYFDMVKILADDDIYYRLPADWFVLDVKTIRKQKLNKICLE